MKLYDILLKINDELNIKYDRLFHYVIRSSSLHENFLRTQACFFERSIENAEIDAEYTVLGVKGIIDEKMLVWGASSMPEVKLCIYFAKDLKEAEQYKEICVNLGYGNTFVFEFGREEQKEKKEYKLHDLIRMCDSYFTPDFDLFSDFVFWSSDNNGDFLRTCYRRKARKLENKTVVGDIDSLIIAFDRAYDMSLLEFVREDMGFPEPQIKLQFIWSFKEAIEDEADWCRQMGYEYIYLLDLETNEMKFLEEMEE